MDDEEDVLNMLINDGYDDDDDLNFEIDSEAEARLLEDDVISSSDPSKTIEKESQSQTTNYSGNKNVPIDNQSNSSSDNGENEKTSNQNPSLLKRPNLSSNRNDNCQFKRPRLPIKNVQNEFFNFDKNMAFKFPARVSTFFIQSLLLIFIWKYLPFSHRDHRIIILH